MTNFKHKIFLIILIFVIVSKEYAQESKYKFDFYGYDQGLDANPNSLAQDKHGFIWIGTWRGLFRFDGVEFNLFQNIENDTTSLSDNNINCIAFDTEENLWVGTNSGLNKFNIYSKIAHRFFNDSTHSSSLSDSYITTLFFDKESTLWIGTKTGGLKKLVSSVNNNEYSFVSYKNNPKDLNSICNNSINSINEYIYNNGSQLIIGTNNGLSILKKESGTFTNYLHDPGNPNSLPNNGVTAIYISNNNDLLIGTNGGYVSFVSLGYKNTFENFYIGNKTQITSMGEYQENYLWIGTLIYGLAELNIKTKTISSEPPFYKKDFPSGSDINAMLVDKEGRMWMGTRWGLHKHDPNIKKFNYKYLSPSKEVWFGRPSSFCRDQQNNLWVGTLGSGLIKFNSAFVEKENHTPNKNIIGSICSIWITEMVISKSGNIWIGTDRGLERYNSITNKFVHYTENYNQPDPNHLTNVFINELYIDKEDNLWIGSAGGVSKYNGEEFTHFLTDPDQLHQLGFYVGEIYQDSKNKYWLGANSLYSFDPDKNEIQKYVNRQSNKTIEHMVFSIVEDDSENLWVASFGGLYVIKKNEEMIHFTTENGLPNNITYGILKDNSGSIWVQTFKGMIKINPEDLSVERYYLEGDFLPNQFGAKGIYKDNDGTFYLGQPKRITFFNPSEINLNKNSVSVVITNLKISDKDFIINKSFEDVNEISLAHDQNRLEIGWAGISYINSNLVKYKYVLEGYNEDWIECGTERKTTFPNLNPGEYTFNVAAYNDDGILNKEAAILRININPPLWAEWWMRSLLAFLFLVIIVVLHKMRVRYLKSERKRQEQFSKKLIQSQEEERKRIAGELHDGLGQNLMIIHNRIQYFLKDKENIQNELEPLIPEVKETIEEVREIARNLHPHQLEQLGLTKAIESIIRKLSKSSEINFNTKIDFIDSSLLKENWIHVYRIVQEALTNIIKHSSATEVKIEIIKRQEKIDLLISDNGVGLEAISIKSVNGFGLENIRERARLLNAKFEISSPGKKGVAIFIEIPINKNWV